MPNRDGRHCAVWPPHTVEADSSLTPGHTSDSRGTSHRNKQCLLLAISRSTAETDVAGANIVLVRARGQMALITANTTLPSQVQMKSKIGSANASLCPLSSVTQL
ncbi:hypothetical protein AAFF_G00279030 [Aldrovandia affinis]|uniref:Uncharacterized protein n=1 Tax=Aldrovandia affinis TaxID=143900 RepID=A0AAD7SR60_9TELE|nr:hypothetical protein AAFF_G00279030 [Aldrovandia affinis]